MSTSFLEQRTLKLLTGGPLTAREIAGELGVAVSTVWGIVAALKSQGAITVQTIRMRGRGNGSGRGVNIYQRIDMEQP